jgi:hypothetical protein
MAHLQALLRRGMLPHALILESPIAELANNFCQQLIAHLMCQTPQSNGDSCGGCSACISLSAGENCELLKIGVADDRRSISIEQVREAILFQTLTRQFAARKVIWLVQADLMTPSAANALLKTLEEPTPDSIILLAVRHSSRLMPTIRSRCQIFSLSPPASFNYPDYLYSATTTEVKADHGSELLGYLAELLNRPVSLTHFAELLAARPREALCQEFAVIVWHLFTLLNGCSYRSVGLDRVTLLLQHRVIDPLRMEDLYQSLLLCQKNMRGTSGANWPLLIENLLIHFMATLAAGSRAG